MREENLRLQRKLQREMERREALCRQLSESESSLEMDDERCVRVSRASGKQQPRLRPLFASCKMRQQMAGTFIYCNDEYRGLGADAETGIREEV